MGLLDGEARGVGGGLTTDPDGRLIVVGPGGAPIAGGGGSAPSGAVDITDRAGRVLGTVVVGGLPAVALDAATLAALEQVGVSGTVALDAASLAALETISVANLLNPHPVSGTVGLDAATLAALENTTVTVVNPTVNPETGLAKDATLTSRLPAPVAGRLPVLDVSADLGATNTAAAGVAVTLTLPAVAGAFHHIARLEIDLYTTAARAGAAAPVLVTTTNLPGSPVYVFSTAAAVGTTERLIFEPDRPMRSAAVNAATTIVCPVVASAIWRVTANYFAA